MRRHDRQSDFFWPLAVLAILALGLLAIGGGVLVQGFDRAARDREQKVVENGIVGRAEEVAHMVVPQVVWDDAVRHLDNRFDGAWAQENIGQFLINTDGFSSVFVMDGADRLTFAAGKAQGPPAEAYGPFSAPSRGIVASVRADEARRGSLSALPRTGRMLAEPIQSTTLAWVGRELYVLTATLVQPDFGSARSAGATAPVVVTAMAVDRPFLASLGRRYMLEGLALRARAADPEKAHASLRDSAGRTIGVLEWRPQDPGRTLLGRILIPILAVITALGAMALYLYRRARRLSEGLVASEARTAHLAYYDSLTGMPNRVLFGDRLAQALEQARRTGLQVAVHCIDLDRFKLVNDTYGHHAGDELIQVAARRMAAQCRKSDTLARLSGDEFALVQLNATPASAAEVAARLRDCMALPVDLAAGRVFVGCSIGITLVGEFRIEPAEAVRQADLALYSAKQTGKNKFCFFEIEMDAAIRTRRGLESDLRAAIEAGELEMVYQPQVDGAGVMTGVEALVRWNHPERGPVSPAFFIPVAEECGLIEPLGFFTLRQAFADSRRWRGLKVAINVSAQQLRQSDFVSQVAVLVEEMKVDPAQFELEITEGILLGDDQLTHDALKRLRRMGFSLALDDFGTGYSSLSYLQRYPINKIKIDRTFITNLGVDSEADAVVGAIIKLARALRLSVIAEGVETADQRSRLSAAGCGSVQGFLFSRPVHADEIDRLREARKLTETPVAA